MPASRVQPTKGRPRDGDTPGSKRLPLRIAIPLLVVVISVPALEPRYVMAGKLGLAAFVGYSSYAMDDINSVMGRSDYRRSLEDISGGVTFGGGLRYRASSTVTLGLDYERLTGSTSAPATGGSAWLSEVEVDASGNAIMATVGISSASTSGVRAGVAAGIGFYSWTGGVSGFHGSTVSDQDAELAFFHADDNGLGVHFGATIDAALGRVARIEALLGLRIAKSQALGVMDVSSSHELDWTGLMTRAGLVHYFGSE